MIVRDTHWPPIDHGRYGSSLLALLPPYEQRALWPHTVPVEFAADDVVRPDAATNGECYFIEHGLIAVILGAGTERRPVEVGLVGPAGLLELSALCGIMPGGPAAVALTAGRALKIDGVALRRAMLHSARLQDLLFRYAYARTAELMQICGCNACHTLDQRLARWMLVATSRLGDTGLDITHDRLAMLLGVRRAGVTLALHILEGNHAIRSRRGRIELRDTSRLAELSCGCERAIEATFAEAMTPPAAGRGSEDLVPLTAGMR